MIPDNASDFPGLAGLGGSFFVSVLRRFDFGFSSSDSS
jgi:hypothetical protein